MRTCGFRSRLRRIRRDEEGASLVEFALILPLFALLLFGIVDFGLVFGGYISVQNEVNAAARAVSIGAIASSCSTNNNPDLCTIGTHINLAPLGVVPNSVSYAIAFPPNGTETQGNAVIVCAQATLKSTTGLTSPFLNGRTFYTSSEILLEQNAQVPSTGGYGTTNDFYYSPTNTPFVCH